MNGLRRTGARLLAVSVMAAFLLTTLLGYTAATSGTSPGLLQAIKKRGKAVVALEAAYEPFEFVENGKIVGYDPDVLALVMKALGVKVEMLDLPFQGILPGLLEKKFDFVPTALLINPERAVKYAFTQPVAESAVGVLKRKGDDRIKKVEDIGGLVVGTPIPPAGPTAALMRLNEELKAKGKGIKEFKYFPGSAEMYVALGNKQVDVAINAVANFVAMMRHRPDTFEIVGTFGKSGWIGWVTRPEDTDVRDYLNTEIRKLIANGELAKLQMKWFGYAMKLPTSGYLPPGAK